MRYLARTAVVAAVATLSCATAIAFAAVTPVEHRRTEDQTYLTFPEWFLVHSPAEYAAFIRHGDPSDFPLLDHVAQLWKSYAAVGRATRKYPFNTEYHVMINVIAASTTIEYGLKSLYEGTFGRLAAAVRGAERTPEDDFAAATAQRYVDFIRDRPWYEFDFIAELKALWRTVPMTGGNVIRKIERRFALSSELLVKAAYGKLIAMATRSSFETPKPVTAVVVDRTPTSTAGLPELKTLQTFDGGRVLLLIPRYERFTPYARGLATQGLHFSEVAGNSDVIVVSLLTRDPALPPWVQRTLIEQPYLTRPGWRRAVVEVPIARLNEAVQSDTDSLVLEHVYDF